MAFKPTKKYTVTIAANAALGLLVGGEYFKILSATGAVGVASSGNTSNFNLASLVAGQGLEKTPFDSLTLTNETAAPNTVTILIGDQNFIDGVAGTVIVSATTVARMAPTFQGSGTVGVASTLMLNSNASRTYWFLQNNSPSANLYFNQVGGPAAVSSGIRVPPMGLYESGYSVSASQLYFISDTAATPFALGEG